MTVRDVNSSVSFANSGMSPQAYVASVMQGEAHTMAGQFAVASTFVNRAQLGGFPGAGGGVLGVASAGAGTAHPQYSGFNPNYSQSTYDMAGAALSGNLSKYGNTGNATYYNATGNNAAYDSGGSVIGGNSFSDQYNKAPSPNYQAPNYGGGSQSDAYVAQNGAAPAGDLPTMAQGGNYPGADENFQYAGTGDHFNLGGGNYGGSTSPAIAPAGPTTGYYSISEGDGSTSTGKVATSAPDPTDADPHDVTLGEITVKDGPLGSTDVPTGPVQPAQTNPAQTGTTQADGDNTQSGYAGDMEIPQALDSVARSIASSTASANKTQASSANTVKDGLNNVGSQISSAADKTSAATTGLSNQVAGSTNSLLAGAQSLLTQGMGFSSDIFVRAFIIILGLIFVAVGLSMFKTVQQNVIQPTVRTVKGGAKLAARATV